MSTWLMPWSPVDASEMEASLGVPFADAGDADYAALCAAAANDYCANLPYGPHGDDSFRLGVLQFACALYQRKPTGGLSSDFDFVPPAGVDPMVSRLLRLGNFQKPVTA